MMLLYEIAHPTPPAPPPTYCLPRLGLGLGPELGPEQGLGLGLGQGLGLEWG